MSRQLPDDFGTCGMDPADLPTGDAPDYTGAVVTLLPSDPAAIAVADGDAPEQLHVTLMYLADDASTLADADVQKLADAVAQPAEQVGGPFEARVSGIGQLGADGATVMFLDSPEIEVLHQAVVLAVESTGVEVAEQWPSFVPHLTLVYEDAGSFAERAAELAGRVGSTVTLDRIGFHLASNVFERTLGAAHP